jgi:polyisoprenoid-binding protein YceI
MHSADFFDVEDHPTLTFTSRRIEALDRETGHYHVTGALTIRDVTRKVSLDTWNVSPQTVGEKPRLAFNLSTVLDRRDWGLTWSRPIQQIADEVNRALTVRSRLTCRLVDYSTRPQLPKWGRVVPITLDKSNKQDYSEYATY